MIDLRSLTPNQEGALRALLRLHSQRPTDEWHSTVFINQRSRPNVTVSTMKSLKRSGLVSEGPHYDFNKPFVEEPPGRLKPIRYDEINTYKDQGIPIIWIPRYSRRWALTAQGRRVAAGPQGPGEGYPNNDE